MSVRVVMVTALLLSCCLPAESSEDAASLQVLASPGGSAVVLPCRIPVSDDVLAGTVEWSKEGLDPRNIVFLYRGGCETFEEKNPGYRYRTNLFMHELKDGNVSLRLSDLQLSDSGTYVCKARQGQSWSLRQVCTVHLSVGAVSEPTLSIVEATGDGVTLQCDSGCWFLEPEVTFLDAQRNIVAADDAKIDRDSTSRCFNVTRRLNVKTADSFTCRVHEPTTNQTRLAHIHVTEACMKSCTQPIVISVVVVLVLSCASSALLYMEFQRRVAALQLSLPNNEEPVRQLNGSEKSPVIHQSSPASSKPAGPPRDQHPHGTNPKPVYPAKPLSKAALQIPDRSSPALLSADGAVSPCAASDETPVGRSQSLSSPRPRPNGAKVQLRNTVSLPSHNRFSVLRHLSEEDVKLLPL